MVREDVLANNDWSTYTLKYHYDIEGKLEDGDWEMKS